MWTWQLLFLKVGGKVAQTQKATMETGERERERKDFGAYEDGDDETA